MVQSYLRHGPTQVLHQPASECYSDYRAGIWSDLQRFVEFCIRWQACIRPRLGRRPCLGHEERTHGSSSFLSVLREFALTIIQLAMWHETGHRAEVTCIQRSPQQNMFAVGYADGSVRLWDSSLGSVRAAFNGHRKAVTALAFDTQGVRLASGSQDTDLIVWDLVADVGLYR